MRRRIIKTALTVALLLALMGPLARMLSAGQEAADANDARHRIAPMLAMLAQSPRQQAHAPVEPLMEIERVWEIEDARREAEGALVVGMRNGNSELGFDAASATFYCTLGLDGGDDWPELSLWAQGADGLRVAWVDDYTYDFRSDAVREGYRYELIAYTDTQYAYVGVVFTGLPTVTLHVHGGADALGNTYTPARVSVSSAAHEAIDAGAWVHLRGGGSVKPIEKDSYRVEFHDVTSRGDEKTARSVLGMPADTDWLLIGNAQERTAVRNHLCWAMWRAWNAGSDAPAQLESRLVELFVDDAYMGLYQLMERIDIEKELAAMGGDLQTDTVARAIVAANIDEYPVLDRKATSNLWIEHRYEARNRHARTFARIEDYAALMRTGEGTLTDEAFAQLAARRVPARELISYFLFSQVCGLGTDNIFNNLYIWTLGSGGDYVYIVSPWDMDLSLAIHLEGREAERGEGLEMSFSLPCRMLDLDVCDSRAWLWAIWQEKRETLLSDDALYAWIMDTEEAVCASGAYARETQRWYGEAEAFPGASMLYYTMARVKNVEQALRATWPAEHMPQP